MTDADYENMAAFSCGVAELDRFFHLEIRECVRHHYLSAYCAFIENGTIIAAFTLMNDALMIGSQTEKEDFIDDLQFETSEEIVDFFNRQSSYPVINIGHLGISKEWQSKGIGSSIIDLVADTFSKQQQSGCQFITVDALNNDGALRFYCKNSFGFQTNRDATAPTRRMYRILIN